MAEQRRTTRRRHTIESYDHRDKGRLNNPPVGLVTPETDRDGGREATGKSRTVEQILDDHFGDVPQEVWDEFPEDFIENMDHYAHGADKR